MKAENFERDLDAEVSASLATFKFPDWLRKGEQLGGALVSVCETVFSLITIRGTLVRQIAPDKRPQSEHEFIEKGHHYGRWGGGPV